MASSGSHRAAGKAKHLRVLLPFTCDSLRIPDGLAGEIGAGEALVVGPPGGRLWTVEVGRDGDGAFLGRGWPEFAAACGVQVGWLLVLRHRGSGVLTVKAFDHTGCLRLGTQPITAAVQVTTSGTSDLRKPQLIRVLPTDFIEKMLLPANFLQQYIPREDLENCTATVLWSLGKFYRIKLEMDQSGVFFTGGWSQFLAFHDITEADSLLLRYEGNMVFTIKVFGPDGCQIKSVGKDSRKQRNELEITSTGTDIEKQQETSSSRRKRDSKNNGPSSQGQKRAKGSMATLDKRSKTNCVYDIGPPTWMKKKIDASMLRRRHCTLLRAFCNAIGFQEPCMITLQDSMDSTKSWQVRGVPYKRGSCQLGAGWKKFCTDMGIKEGDIFTIKVIETTLWHVTITH